MQCCRCCIERSFALSRLGRNFCQKESTVGKLGAVEHRCHGLALIIRQIGTGREFKRIVGRKQNGTAVRLADVLDAEKAVVSPLIASGTHALTVALFAVLRPGDTILSVTGEPYDTLHDVIAGKGIGSLLVPSIYDK